MNENFHATNICFEKQHVLHGTFPYELPTGYWNTGHICGKAAKLANAIFWQPQPGRPTFFPFPTLFPTTPERYFFGGFTRYYTILHNILGFDTIITQYLRYFRFGKKCA